MILNLQALAFLVVTTGVDLASSFAPGGVAGTGSSAPPRCRIPKAPSCYGLGSAPVGRDREESAVANKLPPERPERTLYEVLNASPTDSKAQLRRKYTEAAKLTHPDAVARATSGDGETHNMADFTEIAAAWGVLSDPKERLRYDRSLKAKELADGVGSLIDAGFSVAVPFLFETAPQQIDKTASEIGRTMHDVGERLDKARAETEKRVEKARSIAELERKRVDLVRRADSENKRAAEMQTRLGLDRRVDSLQDSKSDLTSKRADEIVEGFDFLKDDDDAAGDACAITVETIDKLRMVELDHEEKISLHEKVKTELSMIEQKVDSARRDGNLAEDRLEEGRVKLVEAQSAREESENSHREAVLHEKQAASSLEITEQEVSYARRDEQLAEERLNEARRKLEEARAVRELSEKTHKEAALKKRLATSSLETTEEKIGSARRDETLAEDRLAEGRRNLAEAQSAREEFEKTHREAVLHERQAATSLDIASATLRAQQDKARHALRQSEGLNTSKENAYLKGESDRLEDLAAKLLAKAEELRTKAEEIKREAE